MKGFKKILAIATTLVMALGMTITASAEGTVPKGTITVTGAENATLYIRQVVKADSTTKTGWSFVDEASEALFAGFAGDTAQAKLEDYKASSEADRVVKFGNKLAALAVETQFTGTYTNAEPGLYVIKATEEGFTYSPMIAAINYNDDLDGVKNAVVKAKKTPTNINKTYGEGDEYVELGKEIPYSVEVVVPYSPMGSTTAFVVTDTLTGGEYKLETGENADKTKVVATIGNDSKTYYIAPSNNSLTIDLAADWVINDPTDSTRDNKYANATLTLTYTAIATGSAISNDVNVNNTTGKTVKSYTSKLQIMKTNVPADGEEAELLNGAKFVIKDGADSNAKYAILDAEGKLTGWGTLAEAKANPLTTVNGIAIASGFDKDKTYWFEEIEAPQGYSLNLNPVAVTSDSWIDDPDEEDAKFMIGTAIMSDTTLITLPFTGGYGTVAFTVFGILFMSAAAGLFYANKKKSAK